MAEEETTKIIDQILDTEMPEIEAFEVEAKVPEAAQAPVVHEAAQAPEAAEAPEVETEVPEIQPEIIPQFELDFEKEPKLLSITSTGRHFSKGCKWSPDGLCILVGSDDHTLKIYDLPNFDDQAEDKCNEQPQNDLKEAVTVREGENIYDYQWYPLMQSSNPATCVLATTSQYQPIHLHDAFDGHIRATYRCFDHLDEMVAAKSLCFSPNGDKLVAGLKNEIRVFDVAVPGRDCETVKTFTKKEGGLPGIISSIAVSFFEELSWALIM